MTDNDATAIAEAYAREIGRDLCRVDGCIELSHTKGWCVMHYTRWRRHGDPTSSARDLVQKFREIRRVLRGLCDHADAAVPSGGIGSVPTDLLRIALDDPSAVPDRFLGGDAR